MVQSAVSARVCLPRVGGRQGEAAAERAVVNDSPVGCQSRLTEAASSRKKEPYRPHQAKPELVVRLEVTSNGVISAC